LFGGTGGNHEKTPVRTAAVLVNSAILALVYIKKCFKYINTYIHYTSKYNNYHFIVEYCTVASSLLYKDLLLVTQNGSTTVVLLPLQTKK